MSVERWVVGAATDLCVHRSDVTGFMKCLVQCFACLAYMYTTITCQSVTTQTASRSAAAASWFALPSIQPTYQRTNRYCLCGQCVCPQFVCGRSEHCVPLGQNWQHCSMAASIDLVAKPAVCLCWSPLHCCVCFLSDCVSSSLSCEEASGRNSGGRRPMLQCWARVV